MWLDLLFAQVSRSAEQNVHTTVSFPNSLSESEELQSYGCSKFLLSFLMQFDGHFDQISNSGNVYLSSSRLPAPFHLEYQIKMFDQFTAPFPSAFCTNTSVSVADRSALKQNCMTTFCPFPPSMTYKENWLYKTSYNSFTVEDRQT